VQVLSSQVVVPRKVGVASCVAGRILRKVRHTLVVAVLLLRDSLKTVLKILVFRLLEDPQHLALKVRQQADRVVGIRGVIEGMCFGGTSEIVGLPIGIDRGA
jgi:hypothetical protein